MKNLISYSAQKVGAAPGTLSYGGSQASAPVELQYWEQTEGETSELLPLSAEALPTLKETKQWLNIKGLHDLSLLEKLGQDFSIHPLILEDILNLNQRPKVEVIDDCVFVSLKALHLHEDQQIQAHTMSFVITQNTLFSFSELETDLWLTPIVKRLKKSNGALYKKNIYYLLYALLDVLVDQYLCVLESLGDQIQTIDEQIFKHTGSNQLDALYQLKKQILYLGKQTHPVPDLIRKMPTDIEEAHWDEVRIFFDDLLDHSVQVEDVTRTYLDSLNNLFDLYFSLVNLTMNKTIQALTVITVVFLPLTLLAGIYGMNFVSMPGLETPQAFWIMLLVMMLMSLGILLILKQKRWF